MAWALIYDAITPDMSYGKTINDGVKEYKEVLSSTGQTIGYQEIKKEEPKASNPNNSDAGTVFLAFIAVLIAIGGIWFVFFK